MESQIALRKSIRHYTDESIGEPAENALASWLSWTRMYALGTDGECDMRLLPGDAPLKGLYIIKAPGYIAWLGHPTRQGRINAGFALEQISLELTRLGVGTCYLGASHIDDMKANEHGLEPIIFMAYGKPDQTLTRNNIVEFKRKRIDEICRSELTKDMARVVESARIAPSAMNRQPWRIVAEGNRAICCVEHSLMDALRRLSEIDMGIMLLHMLLTAETIDAEAHIEHNDDDVKKAPHGTDYIATLVI